MNTAHKTILILVVESELGLGDEYTIGNDKRIIVGRGDTANIQLPNDNLASREHCEIYFKDSSFQIHDLGSSNGTQLNNQDIKNAKINNNDQIGIGTTLFRAKIEAQEVDVGVEIAVPSQQYFDHESASANDATMAFKSSPKAEPKEAFSLFADNEEEPSPLVENTSSFKVQIMLWQDQDGSNKISIIAKNTFKMLPDNEAQLSDKPIPLFKQTVFYDDKDHGSILYESDIVPFKPFADIVVVGKAHTPNKLPQQILDVGLQVGKTKKIIKVFGDRNWYQDEEEGDFVISEPLPFTSMDLKYEKSFGGSDLDNGIYFHQNPVGCGCVIEESLQNNALRKLPNIENPQNLLSSWESRPDPVGLGFYANNWQPRIQYLGSYDEESLEGDKIGLPKNFSSRFYNSAHPDLQVEGYLEGDEKVELVNLSPKGRLIFNLPNLKPKVLVCKNKLSLDDAENSKCVENDIKMNLDTVVFIPDEDVFYEVFRGVFQLDSMEDIQNISVLVS